MMRISLVLICVLLLQSCLLLNSSREKELAKAESMKPIDCIIVPGLPLYNGKWDTLLKTRILWSQYLFQHGWTKNVIYSGNAVYTPWVEGPSMALFANQLGIDNAHIFIDTIAQHSTENLFYGYQLAKQKGFKTIAIATDPFQCKMLMKYAKKNFTEPVYFLPVIYDSIKSAMKIDLLIDTTITKKKNFISIEAQQGYKERLSGTRGKHIKKGQDTL